jgi:hypothetical protein
LEGDRNHQVVHCAGGEIEIVASFDGSKTLISRQDELGTKPEDLPTLHRQKTGLVEFHCVMVTRKCLDAIGGKFDETLRTTREHVDLCLEGQQAGFEIYLEPTSRVSYGQEEPIRLWDLPYFMFRWSEHATQATIEAFEAKWRVKLDPGRLQIAEARRRRARREVLRRYRLLPVVQACRKLWLRVSGSQGQRSS